MDKNVHAILNKVLAGNRLDFDDGLTLFKSHDLLALGHAADIVRQRKHPENYVTYIVDRNINYTNWCYVDCKFCAFYRHRKDPDAYVMERAELGQKIQETLDLGGELILMQGRFASETQVRMV